MDQTRIVRPGPDAHTVRTSDGKTLAVPADWILTPPGDAALTRRIKAAGPTWTVQEKRGRRTMSLGVWGPAERVAAIRAALEIERAQESFAKRRTADAARRTRAQAAYVDDFRDAVLAFLRFTPIYAALASQLADAVTQHATPVGSGTVARTKQIPLERRAEAAVIAWLRHQTTEYDNLKIPRVKGKRREVRQMLAARSRELLEQYRRGGKKIDPTACLLSRALLSWHANKDSRDLTVPVD